MTPQKSTRCNVTSLDKNNKMNNATLDFLNTLKLNTNPKQAQTVLQQAMEQFSTYTGNNNAGKSWKKCFFLQ